MAFSTVLIIAFAAAAILVVGGGLMVYMSNLVRAAYDIKVQINTEVEERLTKMAEDLDKKSRWIKRDLLEEIEKIKVALQTENARKIAELSDPLVKRVEALELALQKAQGEFGKAIDSDRQAIAGLDQRVRALKAQADRKEDGKAETPAAAGAALDEAAAVLAARASIAAMPATAPEPAATADMPVTNVLPDLG